MHLLTLVYRLSIALKPADLSVPVDNVMVSSILFQKPYYCMFKLIMKGENIETHIKMDQKNLGKNYEPYYKKQTTNWREENVVQAKLNTGLYRLVFPKQCMAMSCFVSACEFVKTGKENIVTVSLDCNSYTIVFIHLACSEASSEF